MKDKLDKQQTILSLLYRFRFLNRTQIQTILKHKYHKKINDWLNDLNKKEYLGRIYSNKIGLNNKPAVYYLSLNGIKYLRDQNYPTEQLKKLYRENERSDNFISKHILIADICLDLQEKSNEKLKYAALTGSDLSDPETNFHFLNDLNPSLVFAKISKDKKELFLLEILEPTLPRYSIKKRISSYLDLYFSNRWEDEIEKPFPVILIVCPTLAMLIYAKRTAKKLLEDNQNPELEFRFAIESDVREKSVTDEIWEDNK